MNRFLLLTLLSVIYCIAKAHDDTVLNDDCSTCRMPCVMSNPKINRSSLIRAYTSSYKDYEITTLLNGIKGYLHATVTMNDTIYSARVALENWPFSILCKVLSQTPTITESKKANILNVHFKTFSSFKVVKSKFLDNYLQYILTEKVAKVQNNLINVKKDSLTLKEKIRSRLIHAFRNADVTGTYYCAKPNPIRSPSGRNHCGSRTGTWMQIDMKKVFLINHVGVHLWDGDNRIYTYTLQVSEDGKSWKDIVVNKVGKSYQELKLPEIMSVRYIRMDGNSNKYATYFNILYLKVELK